MWTGKLLSSIIVTFLEKLTLDLEPHQIERNSKNRKFRVSWQSQLSQSFVSEWTLRSLDMMINSYFCSSFYRTVNPSHPPMHVWINEQTMKTNENVIRLVEFTFLDYLAQRRVIMSERIFSLSLPSQCKHMNSIIGFSWFHSNSGSLAKRWMWYYPNAKCR